MATKKANIVMIYVDYHPGAVMGYAGNAKAYTPNFDRFSQNATLFTEAYRPPMPETFIRRPSQISQVDLT
jgi:arylsulfatase A-like enzyme